VILDIEVPGGMGGSQCIKELRQLDPAVNAVVSSGYSDEAVLVQYREYGFDHVLPKPYKIQELNRLLNNVIKRRVKK
jgi:CheY-like chemotaxis protein